MKPHILVRDVEPTNESRSSVDDDELPVIPEVEPKTPESPPVLGRSSHLHPGGPELAQIPT
jgi:hypothetical protein